MKTGRTVRCSKSALLIGAAMASGVASEPLACGQAVSWISPLGGSANVPTNWSSGTVPGPGELVVFNLLSGYNVGVSQNLNTGTTNLEVGSVAFSFEPDRYWRTDALLATGGVWNSAVPLNPNPGMGGWETPLLKVTNGASFSSNFFPLVPAAPLTGAQGLIAGAGSKWALRTYETNSPFTLAIEQGATWNTDEPLPLHSTTFRGGSHITVDGAGSAWVGANLTATAGADDQIEVRNNGAISMPNLYLAHGVGANTQMNVRGAGSSAVIGDGELRIGDLFARPAGASARVSISDGAVLQATNGAVRMFGNPATPSMLMITGSQTRATIGRRIIASQSSLIEVSDGALLETGSVSIGSQNVGGATLARVIVRGAATRWNNSGSITVGTGNGDGRIEAIDGASVRAGGLVIGSTGDGTFLVSGAGTKLEVTGDIRLGALLDPDAPARLELRDGGELVVGGGVTVRQVGEIVLDNAVFSPRSLLLEGGRITMTDAPIVALKLTDFNLFSPGKIDLGGGALFFDDPNLEYPGPLQTWINRGRAGGAWTGTGITSSRATNDPSRIAVGHAVAGDLGISVYLGEEADATTNIARATLLGDANLDLTVSLADFAILAANFNTSSYWGLGDFDYSGATDLADLALLGAQFNATLSPASRIGTIPEPVTAVILLAGLSMRNARRRLLC